ncbi:hypothetical protein VCNHCC008D_000931 [Vibrio cholerae O1 str. NHCC-008D]|nr:hypothetical protein VCNHCC008D_000931 [Vibrio cholerae O1 str. NHCC-008D]
MEKLEIPNKNKYLTKNHIKIKLSIYSRIIRSNINSRSINILIHNFGG